MYNESNEQKTMFVGYNEDENEQEEKFSVR